MRKHPRSHTTKFEGFCKKEIFFLNFKYIRYLLLGLKERNENNLQENDVRH